MTDSEILQLYFAREEAAITQTKLKFGALVRSIIYNILKNREDTDECENDVYLGAWEHIPPARPEPLRPYLVTAARNTALRRYDYYAADKRNRALEEAFDELEGVLGADGAPDEALELEALGARIDAFLRTVSREARVMFLRRYYLAEPVAETAKRLGVSQSKVKSSLFRTRSGLRDYLIREGYAL